MVFSSTTVTMPQTNSSPLKIELPPQKKGKDRLPTTNFQGAKLLKIQNGVKFPKTSIATQNWSFPTSIMGLIFRGELLVSDRVKLLLDSPLLEMARKKHSTIHTWMSRWKLGSMVSNWVISPTYNWGILGL